MSLNESDHAFGWSALSTSAKTGVIAAGTAFALFAISTNVPLGPGTLVLGFAAAGFGGVVGDAIGNTVAALFHHKPH